MSLEESGSSQRRCVDGAAAPVEGSVRQDPCCSIDPEAGLRSVMAEVGAVWPGRVRALTRAVL